MLVEGEKDERNVEYPKTNLMFILSVLLFLPYISEFHANQTVS